MTLPVSCDILSGGARTNSWVAQKWPESACAIKTRKFTNASDGLRHRSAVTTGGNTTTTDYVLDNSMFVRELQGGVAIATYLVGPRGPEYRRDGNGIKWYSFDGLGSVLGEADLNGNLTATKTFDVYGVPRYSGGMSTTKHGFVGSLGHPSEESTGLIYVRARWMETVTGRFVSEDISRTGKNWLLYVNDSPPTKVDATGKFDGNTLGALLSALISILNNPNGAADAI